jgi:hypothetical protein
MKRANEIVIGLGLAFAVVALFIGGAIWAAK